MDVLAPEVVLLTDGGGIKKAALRPIRGRDKVVRFLTAVAGQGADFVDIVTLNAAPALRLWLDGAVESVVSLHVDDGTVTALYLVRNPEKLSAIDREVALER